MDVLTASQKDLLRVTSLGRPQSVDFEPLVQMHFHCINFSFILPNVYLKHERVAALLF